MNYSLISAVLLNKPLYELQEELKIDICLISVLGLPLSEVT
ncbi:MAG: hypothetical protein SVE93_07510 [Candidatus Thermoplasmatota archaeon]|nr:hypothetical protein [Candidatus Thermoplasmatota archaeon]